MKQTVILHPEQSDVSLGDGARSQVIDLAFRLTMSPHEWTWTQHEQVLMARYVLWAHQRLSAIKQLADGPLVHSDGS